MLLTAKELPLLKEELRETDTETERLHVAI